MLFLLIILIIFSAENPLSARYHKPTCNHIITPSGHSRLGDTITSYCIAQWLSYKYDIPLFAPSFDRSKAFSFDEVDPLLQQKITTMFESVNIESENDLIKILRTESLPKLLTISYSTIFHYPGELIANFNWPDIWTSMYYYFRAHPTIEKKVRQGVMLKTPIKSIDLPDNMISVAVHVRSGSGPDTPPASIQYLDEWEKITKNKKSKDFIPYSSDLHFPLKLPPEQFYVNQIIKLSYLLGHAPLFVRIFTDNKHPQKIVDRFKQRINLKNITFACEESGGEERSWKKSSIIDDVYNMAQFDCLIKAESGFALTSQFIGNHKLIIYPQNSKIYSRSDLNQVMIDVDDVSIIFHDPNKKTTNFQSFNNIHESHQKQAFDLLLAQSKKQNPEHSGICKSASITPPTSAQESEPEVPQTCLLTIKDMSHTTSRLGDNVLSYCTAKWYSYKYDIPFFFSPFKHSNLFSCDRIDIPYKKSFAKNFKTVDISSEDELIKILRTGTESTLCVITFASVFEHPGELAMNFHWPDVHSSIYFFSHEHPEFGKELRNGLTPQKTARTLNLPHDKITVAVHVRKASDRDAYPVSIQYRDEWNEIIAHKIKNPKLSDGCDLRFPLRVPSEQFYVDQIIKLSEVLNHPPLYIYLFTDDKHPEKIIQRLQKRIPLDNITFDYNHEDPEGRDASEQDILDDLYNMSRFNCLIRTQSGFSAISQLIGNHKIIIYPQNSKIFYHSQLNQIMIDVHDVSIIFKHSEQEKPEFFTFKTITNEHKKQAQKIIFQ